MFTDKTSSSPGAPGPSATVLRRFLATDIGEIIFSRDEEAARHAAGLRQPGEAEVLHRRRAHAGRRACWSAISAWTMCSAAAETGALLRVLPDGGGDDERHRHAENVMNITVAAKSRSVVWPVLSTDKAAYPINDGHLQGDDGEAGGGQVACGGPRLHDQYHATATWPLAGRSSPLFIEQIRGPALTITDPQMAFMMSIDGAVDLVLYVPACATGRPLRAEGPRSDVAVLAGAAQLFAAQNEIASSARHGEKQSETLLTQEEMLAVDLGDYYRIPADTRPELRRVPRQGQEPSRSRRTTTRTTRQLDVDQMAELLAGLDYVREQMGGKGLKDWASEAGKGITELKVTV